MAVNPAPTTALRKTCAGITELDILKMPVHVLAMRDEEGDGESEHLELVFGSVDEHSVGASDVQDQQRIRHHAVHEAARKDAVMEEDEGGDASWMDGGRDCWLSTYRDLSIALHRLASRSAKVRYYAQVEFMLCWTLLSVE